VRYETICSLFVSGLLLAGASASASLPTSTETNPQSAEAKAQETVDLKISGMT